MKGGERYVWQPNVYTHLFARWSYQWRVFYDGIGHLLLGQGTLREKQAG